jgi:hypothetical protein
MKKTNHSPSKKTIESPVSEGVKNVKKSKGATNASSKQSSPLKIAGVIGGFAAAAAVGGYFLYHNKDAQKKIKSVKGWVLKAKGEVLEKIENLKEVNQEAYQKAVDGVLTKYEKLSHVDTAEVAKVSKELKSHWKTIQSELGISSKKVAKVIGGAKAVAASAIKAVSGSSATPTKAQSSARKQSGSKMKKA